MRLPFRDKAAGPAGRERAKNLLWAAGKLADYAMSLGLDLVPETVFHPSVVERFARCAPGLSGGVVITVHGPRPRTVPVLPATMTRCRPRPGSPGPG